MVYSWKFFITPVDVPVVQTSLQHFIDDFITPAVTQVREKNNFLMVLENSVNFELGQ